MPHRQHRQQPHNLTDAVSTRTTYSMTSSRPNHKAPPPHSCSHWQRHPQLISTAPQPYTNSTDSMRRVELPTCACARYSQSTHGREGTSFHLWSAQLAVPVHNSHRTAIKDLVCVLRACSNILPSASTRTTYSTIHGQIVKHPPATRAGTTPPLSLRAQHAPGPTSGLPEGQQQARQ